MDQTSLFRYILERLNGTPTHELPRVAFFLAKSIATSSTVIRDTSLTNAAYVHKLRTKVSSLLQDRSSEGRFAAVVLIKALIETLGTEDVVACEPWARTLVTNLNKSDPPKTKALYLACITRIFLLTRNQPSAHREITTALLPAFINSCLNLIKPKAAQSGVGQLTTPSPFLKPVFQCWIQLLPANPATFRPFIARIKPIAVHLISDVAIAQTIAALARHLMAVVHIAAPKNASGAQWLQTCNAAIYNAHQVSDGLFKGLEENWQSQRSQYQSRNQHGTSNGNEEQGLSPLLVSSDMGMDQGVHHLQSLLRLLADLCCQPDVQSDALPVAAILDLAGRLTSVAPPPGSKVTRRITTQVDTEQPKDIWLHVHVIHAACLNLLSKLLQSYGRALLPVWRNVWEQMLTTYTASSWCSEIRQGAYELLTELLSFTGSAFDKQDLQACTQLVSRCCQDWLAQCSSTSKTSSRQLPAFARTDQFQISSASGSVRPNFSSKDDTEPRLARNSFEGESRKLLIALLTHVPARSMPYAMRTEIDRTVVLIGDETAILASTLNPPPKQRGKHAASSLMPFLARIAGGDLASEALLHPRMAVIAPYEMPDMETGDEVLPPIDQPASYAAYVTPEPLQGLSKPSVPQRIDGVPSLQTAMESSEIISESQPRGTIPQKRELSLFLQDDNAVTQQSRTYPVSEVGHARKSVREHSIGDDQSQIESIHRNALAVKSKADEIVSLYDQTGVEDVSMGEEIGYVSKTSGNDVAGPPYQEGSKYSALVEDNDTGSDSDIPLIDAELDTEDEEDME